MDTTGTVGTNTTNSKWAALQQVSLLCLGMLVGAFGAGLLPLYASLSQKQLSLFNSAGTGLLIGTAFAVIIPEGIHQLYSTSEEHESSQEDHEDHHHDGLITNETIVGTALLLGFMFMLFVDHLSCCGGTHSHGHSHSGAHHHQEYSRVNSFDVQDHEAFCKRDLSDLGLSSSEVSDRMVDLELKETRSNSNVDGGELDSNTPPSIPEPKFSHGHSYNQPNHVLNLKKRASVTLGLLVHAAADGLALGAAKASSEGGWQRLELTVFIAIMMHKVPAAFALTLYLRNSGLDIAGIQRNLLLFALAAPIGSFITFFTLHPSFLGVGSVSDGAVAFILLLSAGTFIYVGIVHAFQELPKNHNGELSRNQILAICIGCLLPIALSAGHEH